MTAFTARTVTDQSVEYPNRFLVDGVSKTITTDFGTVTAAGTSINKAYLQPIEDALAELCQVGHTIATVRTDLGDDWLLCNDSEFDFDTYPLLRDIARADMNGTVQTSTALDAVTATEIKFLNGYYVTIVGTYAGGTTLYYCTTLTGTWLSTALGDTYTDITYQNGKWIVYKAGSTALAVSGAINGTYTVNANIPAAFYSNTHAGMNAVIWDESSSCWAIVCEYGMYTGADISGSVWIERVDASKLASICVAQGYYIIPGEQVLWYSTSLTGTWASVATNLGTSRQARQIIYSEYYQCWILLTNYSSGNAGYVYYADDFLNGSWTYSLGTGSGYQYLYLVQLGNLIGLRLFNTTTTPGYFKYTTSLKANVAWTSITPAGSIPAYVSIIDYKLIISQPGATTNRITYRAMIRTPAYTSDDDYKYIRGK